MSVYGLDEAEKRSTLSPAGAQNVPLCLTASESAKRRNGGNSRYPEAKADTPDHPARLHRALYIASIAHGVKCENPHRPPSKALAARGT
jgi:hypothetical protein